MYMYKKGDVVGRFINILWVFLDTHETVVSHQLFDMDPLITICIKFSVQCYILSSSVHKL